MEILIALAVGLMGIFCFWRVRISGLALVFGPAYLFGEAFGFVRENLPQAGPWARSLILNLHALVVAAPSRGAALAEGARSIAAAPVSAAAALAHPADLAGAFEAVCALGLPLGLALIAFGLWMPSRRGR